MSADELSIEELKQHLNQETGKLVWSELERHFARGSLIKVAPELDLIDSAVAFIKDDKASVEAWMGQQKIARADEDDARRWAKNADTTEFWAVVAAPWVLIQEAVEN